MYPVLCFLFFTFISGDKKRTSLNCLLWNPLTAAPSPLFSVSLSLSLSRSVCPVVIRRLHRTWPGRRKSLSSCLDGRQRQRQRQQQHPRQQKPPNSSNSQLGSTRPTHKPIRGRRPDETDQSGRPDTRVLSSDGGQHRRNRKSVVSTAKRRQHKVHVQGLTHSRA